MKVTYYGCHNEKNYGDDIVAHIIRSYGFTFSENSDILMIGAGTTIPPVPSHKPFNNLIDKQFKDVIVMGAGVKDPPNEEYLELFKQLINKSNFVGLRDAASRDLLGTGTVIGDPLYSVRRPKFTKKNYVLLNIGFNYGACFGGMESQLMYIITLLKFVKTHICEKEGYKIVIAPLEDVDRPLCNMASRYLSEYLFPIKEKISSAFSLFGEAKYAITYKQHGMITALVMGTPVLPLAYEQKAINVLKDFNLENHILRIDELDETKLLDAWKRVKTWDQDKIDKKLAEYRKKMKLFLNSIEEKYGVFTQ